MCNVVNHYVLVFQLYTVSRDGALCVWQCDTELDGLKVRPPKDQTEDEAELAEGLDEELMEEQKGKEVHGKASTHKKKEKGKKVKYSCAAK